MSGRLCRLNVPAPPVSIAAVWFSKDLNAFFHCDYPRGKNSNCRKCLIFLPLTEKKKKKKPTRKEKSTLTKCPEKQLMGSPAGQRRAINPGPALQTCGKLRPPAAPCKRKLRKGHLFLPRFPPPTLQDGVSKGSADTSRATAGGTLVALPPRAARRTLAPGGPPWSLIPSWTVAR